MDVYSTERTQTDFVKDFEQAGKITNRERFIWALQVLFGNSIQSVGDEFFTDLITELLNVTNVKLASIVVFDDDMKRARSVVVAIDGDIKENFDFAVKGTPCEVVMRKGRTVSHDNDLQIRFPENPHFKTHGLRSYLSVPIFGPSHKSIVGSVCLMHTDAIDSELPLEDFLVALSSRIGIELERQHKEKMALQYKDIFDHLQDGVVICRLERADDPRSLTLMDANTAADAQVGFTMSDHVGRLVVDIFPELGEQTNNLLDVLYGVITSGRAARLGEVACNGTIPPAVFLADAFPLRGGYLGVSFRKI